MAYKKYFTLSYDDNGPHDRRFVELLNYYGLKCTFNCNSGFTPAKKNLEDRVSFEEMPELYKGHEVAAHGRFHGRYSILSNEEIERDIREDIEKLSEVMGYRIKGFAYPFGTYNDYCVKVLADNGIVYARTALPLGDFSVPTKPLEATTTCHHSWSELSSKMDEFIEAEPTDGDMLLYVWGHAHEFPRGGEYNNWEYIESLFKKISGRKDIEYVTNLQFFERKNSF